MTDNILTDSHIHSCFSSDSDTPCEQIIQTAIKKGMNSICFTDHNDYGYPLENGNLMFALDFSSYVDTLSALKERYKGQITIRIGVEQGLQSSYSQQINAYDAKKQLDFIIGSSHLVYGEDPYYKEYWEKYSVEESIRTYYESMLDNIQTCTNFDVYGHLDYIVRYAPNQDRDYNWHTYEDIIDEVLRALIAHGKGIEINTAGLKYGLKEPNPCHDILEKYHSLGGEIITIGSDAHTTEYIGYKFEQMKDYLLSAGITHYTVFEQRQPHFICLQ